MVIGSLHAFAKSVDKTIDRGDLDLALRSIFEFVERIITEPLCTSQVFGSRELDALCERIGQLGLSAMPRRMGSVSESGTLTYVYIVTKLQKSGGHTRVIEDFIGSRPAAAHVVLSTELCGRSDAEYVQNELTKRRNVRFESAPPGSFVRRLAWLQDRIHEIAPAHTYLFNSHQDSVAVAAVQPREGGASFYHHGDHHLCLGVHLTGLEHIDPHPMGYHNCRDALGIRNTYLPLTVGDQGERPPGQPFRADGLLVTCTAARSNKVEIAYFARYVEVVPALLKTTGGKHIHIGRLSPMARLEISRAMKRNGIPADRFEYIPWVRSVWRTLQDRRVDLYVASFPYGGGLTLIEAMGAGVAVALHNHISSRVLSGIELAYPEAFLWRVPEQLLEYCATVPADELERNSRLGRARYLALHRRELLAEMLNSPAASVGVPEGLSSRYVPNHGEWACWAQSQLSVLGLTKRAAYRLFRRLRSRYA